MSERKVYGKKKIIVAVALVALSFASSACGNAKMTGDDMRKAALTASSGEYVKQIEAKLDEDKIDYDNLTICEVSEPRETAAGSVMSYVTYSYDGVRESKEYICLAPVYWTDGKPDVKYRFDSFVRYDESIKPMDMRYVLDCYESGDKSNQINIMYGKVPESTAQIKIYGSEGKALSASVTNGVFTCEGVLEAEKIELFDKGGKLIETISGDDVQEAIIWE